SGHPGPDALSAIRERIAESPVAWRRARNAKRFAEHFELSGDRLKRPPRGYPADHPCIDDLKRKDFIGVSAFDARAIEDRCFVQRVAADFDAAVSLMRFLCKALGLRF
ncbi:MAG: DUF2461 family protein, partial [Rhodospirillaceae bacterium]|nr:DUF2461 family protein [Rhodospirillaceae bacterium]